MGRVKRAAVYCRVSTDSADQAHSLASQRQYFQEYLSRSTEYTLWGVYADEGITGTSARRRRAFMRMIEDARQGLFDVVITKEISRFARNTLDSIYYTRLLKGWDIGVIFVVDNINTLEPDAELRLTIMSSIAQEESRKISERIKWGQLRSMERGVVFGRDMLGYKVNGGILEIEPRGAETVKAIFYKYVREGKGAHTIARELEKEGRLTARGGAWTPMAVLRILKNEKYAGDLVQKKTYTPNYLDHKKAVYPGEKIAIQRHHQAIISKELFGEAQRQIEARGRYVKERSSAKRPLSGKVFCAVCGGGCVARKKRRKDGSEYLAWRCKNALGGRGCSCPQIGEGLLMEAILEGYQKAELDREKILARILSRLGRTEGKRRGPQKKDKMEKLKDLYIMGYIEKDEFEQRWQELARGEPPEKQQKDGKQAEELARRLVMGEERDPVFLGSIADRIETDGRNITAVKLLGKFEI